MKLKLDENLGHAPAGVLRRAGHDVSTVVEQRMSGADDRSVIEVSRREGRCLVTLDLDFGNPLVFRHADYPGVALVRLPPRITAADLIASTELLAQALSNASIVGKLWIVQRDRIREYQAPDED